jgi:TonB family protein
MRHTLVNAIQIVVLMLAGSFSSFWAAAQETPAPPAAQGAAATTTAQGAAAPTAAQSNWPEPKTPEAFVRRGYEYARLRNFTLALQDANAALALKPGWVSALRLRARAAYELQDYESAVKDYTAVLRQYPDWSQVYDLRGLAYSHSGRYDLAIADYTQAIKLAPYVATPYNDRGWAYLQTDEVPRALQDFDRALELSPEFVRAHVNRAQALDKQNDWQSELVDLEDVIRVTPRDQWARDQYAAVAQRLGLKVTTPVEGALSEPPGAGTADQTAQAPGVMPSTGPDAGVYKPGGAVSQPVPLYKPEPGYTPQARKDKLSGGATFWVTIDAQGNVVDAREVSKKLGDGLDENAIETLHTWKFQPAMREGVPVAVHLMIHIEFKLF